MKGNLLLCFCGLFQRVTCLGDLKPSDFTNGSDPDGSILVSPDRDKDGVYDSNMYLVWTIYPNKSNQRIYIEFLYMDLEYDPECLYDRVEVVEEETFIGTFCGTYMPPGLHFSLDKPVTVRFISDYSINLTGFVSRHTRLEDGALCAAVETGFIGHFRSLDTDGDGLYENSINCRWHILSPFPEARQSKKEVYVTDFNVQDTEDCAFDYVKVRDGVYVHNFCGADQPPLMISTARIVTIDFVTDALINGRGFLAVYIMLDADTECGGILTASTGEIQTQDRNNDGKYEAYTDCPWAIIAQNNSLIELQFHNFSLEYEPLCSFDFLEIYDGKYHLDSLVGRFCGDDIFPSYLSQTNILSLQFHSDDAIESTGFNVKYNHIKVTTPNPSPTTAQGVDSTEAQLVSTDMVSSTQNDVQTENSRENTTEPTNNTRAGRHRVSLSHFFILLQIYMLQ